MTNESECPLKSDADIMCKFWFTESPGSITQTNGNRTLYDSQDILILFSTKDELWTYSWFHSGENVVLLLIEIKFSLL